MVSIKLGGEIRPVFGAPTQICSVLVGFGPAESVFCALDKGSASASVMDLGWRMGIAQISIRRLVLQNAWVGSR